MNAGAQERCYSGHACLDRERESVVLLYGFLNCGAGTAVVLESAPECRSETILHRQSQIGVNFRI